MELELQLIADVGLVGAPNAGKSTLLAALTAARPKIADYPFTTLEPNLGVLELAGGERLVLADVPGLIEGAAEGSGLGTSFLKHLGRTTLVVHVLDCSVALAESRRTFRQVQRELERHDAGLLGRVRVCALNKVDLPGAAARAGKLKAELERQAMTAVPVSAVEGEGLDELTAVIFSAEVTARSGAVPRPSFRVFKPEPVAAAVTVKRRGDAFLVRGAGIEAIVARSDLDNPVAVSRMRRQLAAAGLREALLEAGARGGDTVEVGGREFVFDPDL